jgi:hypothetical protein
LWFCEASAPSFRDSDGLPSLALGWVTWLHLIWHIFVVTHIEEALQNGPQSVSAISGFGNFCNRLKNIKVHSVKLLQKDKASAVWICLKKNFFFKRNWRIGSSMKTNPSVWYQLKWQAKTPKWQEHHQMVGQKSFSGKFLGLMLPSHESNETLNNMSNKQIPIQASTTFYRGHGSKLRWPTRQRNAKNELIGQTQCSTKEVLSFYPDWFAPILGSIASFLFPSSWTPGARAQRLERTKRKHFISSWNLC